MQSVAIKVLVWDVRGLGVVSRGKALNDLNLLLCAIDPEES